MSSLARFAPPTQLDALRALLAGYFDGDKTFQTQLERSLQDLQQLALPELGQLLVRNTTSAGLRRCILQAVPGFDWPEWDTHLIAMLQHEEDPALFAAGCAALGALATRGALEGLERLKNLRRDPDHQAILEQELEQYLPQEAFDACLDAVRLGRANPKRTQEGARRLVLLATPEHLEALQEAFREGDAVACHWLSRILAFLPGVESERLILELFQQQLSDADEARQLRDFLAPLEPLPEKARREPVLAQAEARLLACTPAWLDELREATTHGSRSPAPDLTALREEATGPLRTFLVTALTCLAQGRALGFHALLRDTLATLPSRMADDARRLDDLAGLLAAKADARLLSLEQVLPPFEQAFQANLGGTALRIAYLRLLPCTDQERLDRLLAEPDPARRSQAIEGLGAREDDRLTPFFFKAMNDPVKEVAQCAIRQLGKLASGFPGMMELFRSGQTDRVREAIHFFSENQQQAAVKPLMGFLSSDAADDELMVDAATALGHLGDPVATRSLLAQLHGGKPLALQMALVEALSRLGTAEAALGLLKRSEDLRLPEVLLGTLKGVLAAFPSFEQPLPAAQVPDLERLVQRCCEGRESSGYWLGSAGALEGLFVFDSKLYQRLADAFTQFLVDMRQKSGWDRASHDLIQGTIRTLSRRAASLTTLEDREQAILASLASLSETGTRRMPILLRLYEALSDPEHVFTEASSQALLAFFAKELVREDLDFEEMDLLCRIAEHSGQSAMIEPLEDLYAHAQSPGVQACARKALLALGLTEGDIQRRKPIRSILLFEPNAFFRGRLLSALESSGRTVAVAATRLEAQALLAEQSVDLIISEIHDERGDLWPWLRGKWQHRRCRYLLLSTSRHDHGPLTGTPWLIGTLYKPFPMEELLRVLAD